MSSLYQSYLGSACSWVLTSFDHHGGLYRQMKCRVKCFVGRATIPGMETLDEIAEKEKFFQVEYSKGLVFCFN